MRQLIVFTIVLLLAPVALFIPFAGLIGYVVIAYVRPHEWAYMPEAQISLAVAVATLLGYALFELTRRAPRLLSNWLLLLLWLQLALATLLAHSQELARGKLTELSKTFLMSLLMTAMVDSERRARGLLLGTVFAIGFLAFKSNYGILITLGQSRIYGPGGAFEDNNDYALLLNVAAPIAFYVARGEKQRWLRLACYAISLMMAITVPFTLSRGGFLGLCAIFIGLALKSRYKLAGLLLVLLLGGITFPLLPSRVVERVGTIRTAAETDQSAQMRFDAWRVSWRIMNDHPVFGVGPRNMVELYQYYHDASSARVAHNSYLQMAVDAGVPALLFFLGLISLSMLRLRATRRILQTRAPDSSLIAYTHGLEVGLVGYLVCAIFLSRHDLELIYEIFALAAGFRLIAAGYERDAETRAWLSRDAASLETGLATR